MKLKYMLSGVAMAVASYATPGFAVDITGAGASNSPRLLAA